MRSWKPTRRRRPSSDTRRSGFSNGCGIEHGYAGGYTVVKDYVRIARARSREVFVPLAHPPGHAQVDFGECIGVIGGVRMKLHVFCFDLPQSDAFHQGLSGGDHGSLSRRARLCSCVFRRRADLDFI
jgi:hypothetical protein